MEEAKVSKKGQKNILAIISYIGILCLVPILMKEKDEFVKFHARQGLVLFICEIISWIVFYYIFNVWFYVYFLLFLGNLVGLVWVILSIIGIMNVLANKKQEIPIVGQFAKKIKV